MTNATLQLNIRGMHCGSCALLIDDALADLPGVLHSQTSTKTERSTITHDNRTAHDDIVAAIEDLGYQTEPVTE